MLRRSGNPSGGGRPLVRVRTHATWERRKWYRPGDTIMVVNPGAGVPFTVAVVVGFCKHALAF